MILSYSNELFGEKKRHRVKAEITTDHSSHLVRAWVVRVSGASASLKFLVTSCAGVGGESRIFHGERFAWQSHLVRAWVVRVCAKAHKSYHLTSHLVRAWVVRVRVG